MKKLLMAINILCASAATDAQISSSQDLRDSLAPTGKLRASLYLGGPTNVIVHPTTREMKGVGYEIGKELARRLDIPFEPVIYETPKLLVDDIESGNWDITFIARSSSREEIMKFSETYLSLEQGFLVRADSPIKTMNEVDRPGIRVGVPSGGSVISRVSDILSDEKLVEIGMPQAADLISSGAVDVFSANKGNLFQISDQLPGSRVLDGYFTVDEFALGIPISRNIEMNFLNEFIEEIKEQGLIEGASKRAGVRGVVDQ